MSGRSHPSFGMCGAALGRSFTRFQNQIGDEAEKDNREHRPESPAVGVISLDDPEEPKRDA
jgi:hypothetical protein